jgi:glycosyltransferase 2 family protein
VLALSLGATLAYPDTASEVSADLVSLVGNLPDIVVGALLGTAQLLALLTPVVLVVLAVRWKRPTQVTVAVAAGAIAGLGAALGQHWLDDATPVASSDALTIDSFITGGAFPSGSYLAGLAAAVTVLSPSFSRSWRQTSWAFVGVLCFMRVLTAAAVPLSLVTTVAFGVVVGSLALVALGSPARRFDLSSVAPALRTAGLEADDLVLDDDPAGLTHRLRGTIDGGAVLVWVVGRDERDAELLTRSWRRLRVKGVDENRPGWSPSRLAEHEALTALLAGGAGVRTPTVVATAQTEPGDGVLVTLGEGARALSSVSDEELTDVVLADCWTQMTALHRRGIAHGRANLAHFELDASGAVQLRGFRAAQLGADDRRLGIDVAELLGAQAERIGTERAIAAAVAAMPAELLQASLPMLQPLAVSKETRAAVKKVEGKTFWTDLRTALAERIHAPEYELTKLQRISAGQIITVACAGFLILVLLGLAANWSEIAESFEDANWAYLPWIVGLALFTYVTGAWSLMGCVPIRLPIVETTQVMFGQAFLNRFTPANAGGMALRIRYLQHYGIDLTLSAASIGLTSAASGVMQVLLLVGFGLWAGSTGELDFSLPDMEVIAWIVAGVLVLAGVVYLFPWGRRLYAKLFESLRKAAGELLQLARSPMKMLELFGGAGLGKLCTITCFVLSCRAFGVTDLSYPTLAFAYMTANTVASAAPTPGGMGAIEAALLAVLTGLHVDSATALSIVIVFRLITYWLPVIPAWFCLRLLRSRGTV